MTFESEELRIVVFYIWLPPASHVSENSGKNNDAAHILFHKHAVISFYRKDVTWYNKL